MTRLIIAGGRDFRPLPIHTQWLDDLRDELAASPSLAEAAAGEGSASSGDANQSSHATHANLAITEVVSGMARGADIFGFRWARSHNIPIAEHPALWAKNGPAAGPIRNRKMAENADAVVLFPGGRGTQNMYETALDLGLTIYDWRDRK